MSKTDRLRKSYQAVDKCAADLLGCVDESMTDAAISDYIQRTTQELLVKLVVGCGRQIAAPTFEAVGRWV